MTNLLCQADAGSAGVGEVHLWSSGAPPASLRPCPLTGFDTPRRGGPYPEAIGGLTIVEVPSREEALEWAAKIAVGCRCAQEVREFGPDPELDEMLRQAESA